MSTTAPAAAPAPARPTLSASLTALLRLLARGADAKGFLPIDERGGAQNRRTHQLNVSAIGRSLPEVVLGLLEHSLSPCLVGLAVTSSAGGPPASVSALAIGREFNRQYVNPNPKKRDSPHGRRHVFPTWDVAAYAAQLEALALPPSIVVSALPAVVALWALDAPLPAKTAAEQAAVLDVLRGLARAVGGVEPAADADLRDVRVPLIGARVRNMDSMVAECLALAERRVYSPAAVESFLRKRG